MQLLKWVGCILITVHKHFPRDKSSYNQAVCSHMPFSFDWVLDETRLNQPTTNINFISRIDKAFEETKLMKQLCLGRDQIN
jgi:hypothetical protein